MRRSRDNEIGSSLPFRAATQRVTLLVLIFAATALFIIGKNNKTLAERARTTLADMTVPILDVLSQPIVALNWVGDQLVNAVFVYQENAALREENRRLLQWQMLAQKLQQENDRFSHMLNVRNERPRVFLTPRVVADSSGPFVSARLLNAGAKDGVEKTNVAMDDHGVVGQVVAVGERSARLLLLTDLNSRVPVSIGVREYPAILAGDNSRLPTITFLPVGIQIRPGDRVVTSGAGGVFPPRMPVGRVIAAEGSSIRVQLFAEMDRLDFVHLLDFDQPRPPEAEPAISDPSKQEKTPSASEADPKPAAMIPAKPVTPAQPTPEVRPAPPATEPETPPATEPAPPAAEEPQPEASPPEPQE